MPKFKNTNERVNEISNYPNSPKPKQKTETNETKRNEQRVR